MEGVVGCALWFTLPLLGTLFWKLSCGVRLPPSICWPLVVLFINWAAMVCDALLASTRTLRAISEEMSLLVKYHSCLITILQDDTQMEEMQHATHGEGKHRDWMHYYKFKIAKSVLFYVLRDDFFVNKIMKTKEYLILLQCKDHTPFLFKRTMTHKI